MNHYDVNRDDMILRDYLAIDRTKLANERTYLSFIRTSISFLLTGVGFIKLTNERFFIWLGVVLAIVSPLFLIVGTVKYFRFRAVMRKLDKNS